MLEQISELKAKALEELEASSSMENLDEWQNRYLSRKGQVKLLLKEIGKLEDPQGKKSAYGEINPLSKELERLLEERKDSIQKAELDAEGRAEIRRVETGPFKGSAGRKIGAHLLALARMNGPSGNGASHS